MSVELANLIVNSTCDPNQVKGSLAEMLSRLQHTKTEADKLEHIKPKADTHEAKGALDSLGESMKKLLEHSLALVGLDLSKAFGLATIAGFVGIIGAGVHKVIEMTDHLSVLKGTFRAMGLEADETAERYEKFAAAMAKRTTLGKAEVLQLAEMATRLGVAKDKALALTQAAIGLSARLGKGPEEIIGALARAQIEGGGEAVTMMLRRLAPEIRQATLQGKDLNTVIQDLAKQGFDIWAVKVNTMAGRIDQMKKSFGALTKEIGAIFAPVVVPTLEATVNWLTNAARAVTAFAKEHEPLIRRTVEVALAIGAAKLVVDNLGLGVRIVSGILVGPFSAALRTVATGLIGLALSNPFTALALGVTAVAVAFGYATLEGETFSAKMGSLVETLKGWFQSLQDFVLPVWDRIKTEGMLLFEAVQPIWEAFAETMQGLWDGLMSTWQTVKAWVGDNMAPIWEPVKEEWMSFGDTISSMWDKFLLDLRLLPLRISLFKEETILTLEGLVATGKELFIGFGAWLGSFVPDIFKTTFDRVKTFMQGFVDSLKERFNELMTTLGAVGIMMKEAGTSIGDAMNRAGDEVKKALEAAKELGEQLDPERAARAKALRDQIAKEEADFKEKMKQARQPSPKPPGKEPKGQTSGGDFGDTIGDLGLQSSTTAAFKGIGDYFKDVTTKIAGGEQNPNKQTADNTRQALEKLEKLAGLMGGVIGAIQGQIPVGTLPG